MHVLMIRREKKRRKKNSKLEIPGFCVVDDVHTAIELASAANTGKKTAL